MSLAGKVALVTGNMQLLPDPAMSLSADILAQACRKSLYLFKSFSVVSGYIQFARFAFQ